VVRELVVGELIPLVTDHHSIRTTSPHTAEGEPHTQRTGDASVRHSHRSSIVRVSREFNTYTERGVALVR
jgi:hypothetical protein